MEGDNEKGKRITVEQRELMLDFMLKHPALATNKFTALDGAKHKQRLLSELTSILNSVANGVNKSPDKWLKSWQDWRSDTKSKAAILKKEINKTGGGKLNPRAKPLTQLEERLLSFLGPTVVSGHEEVADPLLVVVGSKSKEDLTGSAEDSVDEFLSIPLDGPPVSSPVNILSAVQSGSSDIITTDESCSTATSPAQSVSSITPHHRGRSKRRKSTFEGSAAEIDQEEHPEFIKLSQRQVDIQEETLNLQKQQFELQKRQASAIESAASAFVGAMKAVELYYKRQAGVQDSLS